ncbi:CRISPR-associated endoribonuclease Cas6 [Metallosphaera tengchongensis]|uniref:CRISPR-associated endoribonuclease Cas6 n=1 Tax=Metallosphaera tengchongensis TaxID=1532350 RepID=A0A6N0NX27_9CREN|nr:CRISPR-associated endoribonuclease Cas6 [Metallosphaera tengchongensis]QKR00777.1 CRISPR-associated endoribonuclease Cas6 [Metallosphaera tengchongensis]
MLLAEVSVSPENDAIIPPFSSKVAKTMLLDPKDVSISPLKRSDRYLIKFGGMPRYLQVFSGEVYSFEVGGEEDKVLNALTNLDSRKAFNTLWRVVDVKVSQVRVDLKESFEVKVMTPALLVSPHRKDKRKVFTNRPSVVFFNNVIDVTKLGRGDQELNELLSSLDHALREEPSVMYYAKVIYAGKEVVGLTGRLRYSLSETDEVVVKTLRLSLESAVARGIGSSRRNGFGRVKVMT